MTDPEKKADVARAIIAHVLNLTQGTEGTITGNGIETRERKFGEIHCAQSTIAAHGFQIVDVWHGPKVFSARGDLAGNEWELVSFKRGDWESAFLCAA